MRSCTGVEIEGLMAVAHLVAKLGCNMRFVTLVRVVPVVLISES